MAGLGETSYRHLKWQTFGVAAVGLAVLLTGMHLLYFPHGPLGQLGVRLAVLSAAVLLFNEYVFRLIARADAALQGESQRLYALHQISEGVTFLPALERNLGATLEIARQVCGAAVVAWMEPGGAEAGLRCRVLVGDRRSAADEDLRLRFGQDLPGRALHTGRLVAIEDISSIPPADRGAYPLLQAEGLRSGVALGATVHDHPVGVLTLGWRTPHRLSSADREFIENVANVLGVAAENLRLYRETQRLGALEERERIAREMHDGFAQTLTYLKLKAESALLRVRAGGRGGAAPAVAAALEEIRRGAVEALGDVRQAIMDLKAPIGASPGDFTTHLAAYLHSWSRLNDIDAELLLPQGGLDFEAEAEIQVLRICQEALANVRKHARADRVWVRLSTGEDGAHVSVADDGRGFDPSFAQRTGHFGLGILRERAAAIGGTVTIQPRPGGGTEVVLHVPGYPAAHPLPGGGEGSPLGSAAV